MIDPTGIAEFPEHKMPLPEREAATVAMGRALMADMRAAVCMLARDVAPALPATIARVERLASMFAGARIFVVENDSTDATCGILGEWESASPAVKVESFCSGQKKWGMVRNPERGADMAGYRNQCREMAVDAGPFDAVIVLDSDLSGGWSHDGIAHSFGHWRQWDAVASNGLRRDGYRWVQADAWALRSFSWKELYFPEVKNFIPKRGEKLHPLHSAFGGLALYTWAAYCSAEYGGGDCEHVVFHRAMRSAGFSRFFLNPSQVVIYRW